MKKKLLMTTVVIVLLITSVTLVTASTGVVTGTSGCGIWLPTEFGSYTYSDNGNWIYYLDKGIVVGKCFGALPVGIEPPDDVVIYSAGSYPWSGSPCGSLWTEDWNTTIYPDGKLSVIAKWRCTTPYPDPYPYPQPPPPPPPPPYPYPYPAP